VIVFYISGHGFGHASRSIELANALVDRRPGLRVEVRSEVAPWLVERTARPGVTLVPARCDTGVVQIDSLRLDERATVAAARAFMDAWPARVAAEAAALDAARPRLVVADIPPLGIAAAAQAGVPAVALGNFSWDWVYRGYDGGAPIADRIAGAYRAASFALRLPMWGGFAAFRRIVDLPFIARRSRRDPRDVRRRLGFPPDLPLALVSFGGYGVDGLDLDALTRLDGYGIVVSGAGDIAAGSLIALDEPAMYGEGLRYEDVVRAVDVVVSKPGYGIIAECLANDTALLYTSRGHFVEYDVLVEAMPRFLRCGFIGNADLLAGHWKEALDAVLAQPAPREKPATDGADVAADLLIREFAL
jgi:L-arabinokinase